MSRMVCGRCGNATAENSKYCPHDGWTLWGDARQGDPQAVQALAGVQVARGVSGFLARRREEGAHAHHERDLRHIVDPRLQALEKRVETNPQDWEAQRELGLISFLEEHFERANAHFERAHQLNAHDLQTHVNFAVTLARRNRTQPAIDLLQAARAQWPDEGLVLYNLALIALQARRPPLVLEAVRELNRLAEENKGRDYRDEALAIHGLALLQAGQAAEAHAVLEAAARRPSPRQPNQGAAPGAESGDEHEPFPMKEASADLMNNLAMAEAALGNIEQAAARLGAALYLEPGHPRVLNNLGVLAYQQGQSDLAFKYLEMARQVEEDGERTAEPAILNHLGVVLAARGQLSESLEQFQRAGGQEAAEFEVFYNLGRAYIEHGKADRGVESLRHAFALNPNQPDVHVVLGVAYLLRGRAQMAGQAQNHFKRALQIDAQHAEALTNLTLAFREAGEDESALRALQAGLKAHPHDAATLYVLALSMMNVGDEARWAEASKHFEGVLRERPDLVAALYNHALCQFLMGFRDAASQRLEAVTQRDPSLAPAYFLIGVGHAQAKRYAEALTAWHTAEKYEPHNADLQANMAYIYYQRGDWPNAIKHYMAAHRAAPADFELLAALGLSFARAQMFKQAIMSLEQSLQLNARAPVTHSNLGLAYYINTMPEKAIDHWRMVSQLDPGYAARREEEQTRSYDDSFVALRPFDWRARTVKLAPVLPRPHTLLLPGDNARALRPMLDDAQLQKVARARHELKRLDRSLAWMNVKG